MRAIVEPSKGAASSLVVSAPLTWFAVLLT
jgi:hypothetical protein